MDYRYLLMTPNLRFNKKLTKLLLKSIPDDDEKLMLSTIDWQFDHGNTIIGSWANGWFGKNTIFILTRGDNNLYRLVVGGAKGIYGIYIIDNIDRYTDYIGVEKLDLQNTEELLNALKEINELPSTGIIIINEEDKIFVYDHANYEVA